MPTPYGAGDRNRLPREPGHKPFAVEYRSPTGRIETHRVEARTADEAMAKTVTALKIDFAAIQTTEERGA